MSDTTPSRKRPRTEEPGDAEAPEPPGRRNWTTLDEGQVPEAREGEVEATRGESHAEGEEEGEDMDEDEDEERIRDEDGTVVLVAESVEFRVYQGRSRTSRRYLETSSPKAKRKKRKTETRTPVPIRI